VVGGIRYTSSFKGKMLTELDWRGKELFDPKLGALLEAMVDVKDHGETIVEVNPIEVFQMVMALEVMIQYYEASGGIIPLDRFSYVMKGLGLSFLSRIPGIETKGIMKDPAKYTEVLLAYFPLSAEKGLVSEANMVSI
jgi:hypothetical protein